jgi:hypothetical protein
MKFHIDDPRDRIYGPGNPDYEYDGRVQDKLEAERATVSQAFRDIERANFNSEAVNAVMGRRAGSIEDYARMKDLYAAAVSAVIHSRVA